MKHKHTLIISLIIIAIIVIFIMQNAAVVEIHLLFWTISMSRILLMFILLAVGMITGWLLNSYAVHRKKKGVSG